MFKEFTLVLSVTFMNFKKYSKEIKWIFDLWREKDFEGLKAKKK